MDLFWVTSPTFFEARAARITHRYTVAAGQLLHDTQEKSMPQILPVATNESYPLVIYHSHGKWPTYRWFTY